MNLNIEGAEVFRVSFENGILLSFSNGRILSINAPFTIASGRSVLATVDPSNSVESASLLVKSLWCEARTTSVSRGGDLEIVLGDNTWRVPASPDSEAWTVSDISSGFLVVSGPNGELTAWSD